MVGDLVNDRDPHLAHHVGLALRHGTDGSAEDCDPVRHDQAPRAIPRVALGQRNTLVASEKTAIADTLLDHDRDVVDVPRQLGRDLVERVGHKLLEALGRHIDHGTIVGCFRYRCSTLRLDCGVGLRLVGSRTITDECAEGFADEPGDDSGDAAVEALLRDLDASQRRAVTSRARPLAILAPAGSGKTRVLTRRIAWRVATGDAESAHVLALTFTRKAAGELRARLTRLGLRETVAAGTFHSIAYAQLRSRWADRDQRAPGLVPRKSQLLAEVLRGTDTGLSAAAVAGEIEWAKARLLGPDGYVEGASAQRRRTPAPPERVASVYVAYEELKGRRGLVDFDDLLKVCGDVLLDDADFAAAQRWRFRHLFVDEFQDVNPLQLRLLDAWRGDHYDVCVVGDPQQAIYGWNGADAKFLEQFRTLYPSAEVLSLEHNYRSTPQVLSVAGHVLDRARLRPTTVHAVQPDGAMPRIERFPTDIAEATGVARAVRDHRTPRTPWSAQAVLVRTHGQVGLVTEGLRAGGVPYKVRGSALLNKAAVRAALDLLAIDRQRPLSSCLPDLNAVATQLHAEATMGAGPPTGLGDDGDGPRVDPGPRAEDPITTLAHLAHDHLSVDPRATAGEFSAWLVATLQTEGAEPGGDAVTVATFHAAKGLEWPVVHLAGLEDGFVPLRHARSAEQRAEEARLLYVAMTRAVRHLSCSWAAVRSFNGRAVDRRVCPWLRHLVEASDNVLPKASAPVADVGRRLAEQRELLAKAGEQPSPALAVLRAWRDEAARAARVQSAEVIDDDLLEAVARAQPANNDELAAIPGIGRALASRLGSGILTALQETSR